MFNRESGMVKTWVRLIKDENSEYTVDNVPNISNLRAVVAEVLADDNK